MRVKTTGGSTWRISRRVLPWRRRIRAGHLVMDLLDILGFGSNSFRGGGGNLTDLPTPLAMLVLLVWLLVLIPARFLAARGSCGGCPILGLLSPSFEMCLDSVFAAPSAAHWSARPSARQFWLSPSGVSGLALRRDG